jgi:phage/plasmid-associated DNA primase
MQNQYDTPSQLTPETTPEKTEAKPSTPSTFSSARGNTRFWYSIPGDEKTAPVLLEDYLIKHLVDNGYNFKIMREDQSSGWMDPAEFGFVAACFPGDPPAQAAQEDGASEIPAVQPSGVVPPEADSSTANCTGVVDHLRALLGYDVVLLPCHYGKKGPRHDNWSNTKISAMSNPEYLEGFSNATGIAVLLGKASGGLCSIDIDNDEEVEPFLARNPKFRETLRSRGRRGCNLWVRFDGEYPPTTEINKNDGKPWGEWRSTGSCTMIHGLHPEGMTYVRSPEVPPITVRFEDINWPEHLDVPWRATGEATKGADGMAPGEHSTESDAKLIDEFGMPFYFTRDRNGECHLSRINEAYWAGLYSRENTILYEPDEKIFFKYYHDDGLYKVISVDRIKQVISGRMLDVSREKNQQSALEKLRTDRSLNAVVSLLRGIAEKRGAFANRPRAVHLANCMLKFQDGGFVPVSFSPDFLSRNRSPIAYVPGAAANRFFSEFLLAALSLDDAILLQKIAGQLLLGENISQRFLILDGAGGRGKSTASDILQALVGRSNITQLRTAHLGERFELFRYLGRTLLTSGDVDAGFLSTKGASVVKGLVGGDWFDAEQKNGTGSYHFQGKFNVIITSNSRLRMNLQGDVEAWRRRLLIIRFMMSPPKRKIPNFSEILIREEGPGILNWALGGLKMLMRDIEETGDVRLTDLQELVVDSLLVESDSLRFFLRDNVMRKNGCDLSVAEIMQAYAHYCPDKGWFPMPEGQITHQLPTLMLELFQTVKSNSCKREGRAARGYRGVAFINPEALP